jgi:hypothetical protein
MRPRYGWRTARSVPGRVAVLAAIGLIGAVLSSPAAVSAAPRARAAAVGRSKSCADVHLLCTEVQDSEEVFGEDVYVGHDEPSLLFYSSQPGSGNQMRYDLTLPSDPVGPFDPNNSYNAELRPAFWFGMALCDTQSYPLTVAKCAPDSDRNIVDPAVSSKHPGTAFMELQFYPPGFVEQFTGFSCDPTSWCAALTIDSLSENPFTGQLLNATCQSQILGGLEYVNFAYVTKTGVPQGPPNPLQFDFDASGNPGPTVLYMGQGDHVSVSIHDTASGVQVELNDQTTGESGTMTASAANGFGQIQFIPNGKQCHVLPYNFHPMYSTSSPATRVIWAAHSYNVAFSDEIGHFDFCSDIDPSTGSCRGLEGSPGDQEPADGDDNGCFGPADSTNYPLMGCFDTNTGFDGTSYKPVWPDGAANHPTAVLFSSPLFGPSYDAPYSRVAFEADLPRIEAADLGGPCDRTTGANCTQVPLTDDGAPADFYPFYTANDIGGSCRWAIGNELPTTTNDFGGTAQVGPLLQLTYMAFGGHGATVQRYNDFRNIMSNVPC